MSKVRIGIVSPSEIAFRRFMPAISKDERFEYVGVAYPTIDDWNNASSSNLEAEQEKADNFVKEYGGKAFEGYKSIITSSEVDAIYLPLPPALHYKWGKFALENNKHLFLEKPSTTNYKDTSKLVELAKNNDLALHENYMFQYHSQIDVIKKLIKDNVIGETRLIRANFGFPKREANDFRYNKALGGGALLDCGGYPLRLISVILGEDVKVNTAKLIYTDKNIDLYGSVQLSTENQVSQISFGMDNAYKCDIEVWGNRGTITTNRVFTAPTGFEVEILVTKDNQTEVIKVDGDDSFFKSVGRFHECIVDNQAREDEYKQLLLQMKLVDDVRRMGQI